MDTMLQKSPAGYRCESNGKRKREQMEKTELVELNGSKILDRKSTNCIAQESESSRRKELSLPGFRRNMEDLVTLHVDKNAILLPEIVGISSNRDSSGLVENRDKWLTRPMNLERESFPRDNLHIPYNYQNAVLENRLNYTENGTDFYKRRFAYDGRNYLSGYPLLNMRVAEVSQEDIFHYSRIPSAIFIRRKLLVLDLNGLLAHIMMPAPHDCTGDAKILGRTIFKRPFCDDFLKFCFQNFDVGAWSSRSKKIIDAVAPFLFQSLEAKLLFRWDMSHCTLSGFNTLEKRDKPLVFKEMRKIWESDDPYLPWKRGHYNESNTLLLDDSPYKALLNPEHTAIFPSSYLYEDKNDNSLGPGGDIRGYLEGLLTAEHVQRYVSEHPFGQKAIDENNKDWRFYSMLINHMEQEPTFLQMKLFGNLTVAAVFKYTRIQLYIIAMAGKEEAVAGEKRLQEPEPVETSSSQTTVDGDANEQVSSITMCFSALNMKEAGSSQKTTVPSSISAVRKLLILDLNGLLADIVFRAPYGCRPDAHILGRAIFRRPFCDDFLKFCFQNFDVGVWSSRSKKIIDAVAPYLFQNLEAKLLFRWDMSHSTLSGFNTLEKSDKPLVFKEIRKIWENDDPYLPWKRGHYNDSNTLLLDDSPYKALLNPEHTAIYPYSYRYQDKNDNSLGPGGDLRVYLEGLLNAEHVQRYVLEHPFGQRAIDENNKDWQFYSMVVQSFKIKQKIIRQPVTVLN